MNINQTVFNQILESIPPVKVHLDWSGEEGQFESEDHEILTGKNSVFANVSVYESGKIDAGDYFTPPSFHSYGESIYIKDPVIFSEDENEDLVLTSEQEQLLISKIESLILIEN